MPRPHRVGSGHETTCGWPIVGPNISEIFVLGGTNFRSKLNVTAVLLRLCNLDKGKFERKSLYISNKFFSVSLRHSVYFARVNASVSYMVATGFLHS